MASKDVLDISSLISPINADSTAGIDIRLDPSTQSLYHQIKDTRNQASNYERLQREGESTNDPIPLWNNVSRLANQILMQQSKDLDVCAWYMEALTRLAHFAGLRDGLKLTLQLITQYWDTLFPAFEQEDPLSRVSLLVGLSGQTNDGTLILPIMQLPITTGKNAGPIATWQYQQAISLENITDPDTRKKRIDNGAVLLSEIQAEVNATPVIFYNDLLDDIKSCLDLLEKISQFLDEKYKKDSPSFSNLRNVLTDCLTSVENLSKPLFAKIVIDVSQSNTDNNENVLSTALATTGFSHREQAFQQLLKIADFFSQTEPHSPVPYLVQKAVRLGKLGLPQLLTELIKDDNLLKQIYTITGIEAS